MKYNRLLKIIKKISFYTLLNFLLQIFIISSISAFAQINDSGLKKVKVNLDMENSTLDRVFSEIENQTDYKFFYIKKNIPLNDKTTIKAKNESLVKVLEKLAKQHNLTFKKINNQIVVKKKYYLDKKGKGKVKGVVIDSQSKEPLIGANVMIKGTSIGAATNINGEFVLSSIKPGEYILKISYVGYKDKTAKIIVKSNKVTKIVIKLDWIAVEEKTVLVTAQAKGQRQAINQQLSSDQIINVVSAEKIQELPDANAAESLGRLPGISVLRNGGEGCKVVIRGLAPKYNKITIDGEQMSSSDPNNRSTDLSMISSYMLEGIQVSKTVTPDMDADVIGGTVEFNIREAKATKRTVPQFEILSQFGYNNLSNAYNKNRNYKLVLSGEDRFFDKRFGLFILLDAERKNLTSNEMGANYTNLGNSTTQYSTLGLNIYDIPRDRQRYNVALVMDYKIPEGKIKLTNFFTSGSTESDIRNENFDIPTNSRRFNFTNSNSKLNIMTNILGFEDNLSNLKIDAKLSHTYSETKNPDNWTASFLQTSVGINKFNNLPNIDPRNIPKAANNDLSTTYLNTFQNSNSISSERSIAASLDLATDYNFSDFINMKIKFGGKYRYQKRSYDYEQYDGQSLISGSAIFVDNLINSHFSFPPSTAIPITYFIDPEFNYGKMFKGDYTMAAALSKNMLSRLANLLEQNLDYIAENNGAVSYGHDKLFSTTYDYSGYENKSAFYIMPVFNIGSHLNIITGVRYQNLRTTYTGVRGIQSVESWFEYNHYDTTVTRSYGYWLPTLSIKYKPFTWFDVRLSYTNTLSYPNYNTIIPRINLGGFSIQYVNYELLPSRSSNYDIYFSFYNNTIGLVTIGGFLKKITDLIFPWSFYASGEEVKQYLPLSLIDRFNSRSKYQISTFVNNSYRVDNYGLEFDWQTHLWYLPEPLSGLVFSCNYTHILSKADYPFTYIKSTGRRIQYIDTSYTAPLLYQPDEIINLSLGYDYKGFSIRISMLYQADIFTGPNFWPQLRSHTSAYTRWDISAKQELPWPGIQILGDLNNINGAKDVSVIKGGGVPISMQDYGPIAHLGIRVKL